MNSLGYYILPVCRLCLGYKHIHTHKKIKMHLKKITFKDKLNKHGITAKKPNNILILYVCPINKNRLNRKNIKSKVKHKVTVPPVRFTIKTNDYFFYVLHYFCFP